MHVHECLTLRHARLAHCVTGLSHCRACCAVPQVSLTHLLHVHVGPDGLWAGSTSLTLDFANIVLRIKALGFNAVRLPFSFKVSTACTNTSILT